MYIIKDEKDIKTYQKIFLDVLRYNTISFPCTKVGFHGESRIVDLFWSSKFRFWSSNSINKGNTRYLNWFGLTHPDSKNINIDVEISISFIGSQTAGKFISDGNKIYVAHNGNIKKNRTSLQNHFLSEYKGRIEVVENNEVAIIDILPLDFDELKYNQFQKNINEFITKAKTIKDEYIEEDDNNNLKSPPPVIPPTPKPKTVLIKKHDQEKPLELVRKAMISIQEINRICINYKKREIFLPKVFELRNEIETTCINKDSFNNFSSNLYKLIRENTRYKNPKRTPPYDYMLPNFFINDSPTKEFWKDVNTLRHDHAHTGNSDIADLYEKYLNNRIGPETPEDYEKLQIEVLKQFELAMSLLLEKIKKDPNCLK